MIISGLFLGTSAVVIMAPGPDTALVTYLVGSRRSMPAACAAAGMLTSGAGYAGLRPERDGAGLPGGTRGADHRPLVRCPRTRGLGRAGAMPRRAPPRPRREGARGWPARLARQVSASRAGGTRRCRLLSFSDRRSAGR